MIFDRWGETKYERNGYGNDWDGKDLRGNSLSRGTYFYSFTNGPDAIHGFVELIDK